MSESKLKPIKIGLKKWFNKFIEKYLNYFSLVFLVITLLLYGLSNNFSIIKKLEFFIYDFLKFELLVESRVSTLTTISVVLIGFYITVMSVFGTSQSKAIVKISRNNLGDKFMNYANRSIVTTFVYFLATIFFDLLNHRVLLYSYTSIFIYMITNFIRFSSVVLAMYKENITEASDIMDQEIKEKKQLLKLLREIKDSNSERNNQDSEEKLKKMIEKTEKEKENAPEIPEK
ncbi:hypothetical protein [Halanaerobium congolense]|uniref:Uncharacterized protein n=1 Tax=Halanaerobium congolense TaxID=54121 RepID=A0A1G6MPR5_9FIRM|nr:hypothetical protein [Halanaerobium congolense]SDC57461.1 hypothetical protein SAMN04488597_10927 [Halanaerobium congolense]